MPLKLRYSRVGTINVDEVPQLDLQITLAEVIPQEIFVHRVDLRGAEYDKYISISSVTELDSLPSSRVGVNHGDFYRKSSAVIKFSSTETAKKEVETVSMAIRDLFYQYKDLVDSLDINDTVELT